MKRAIFWIFAISVLCLTTSVRAQHTLGFMAGYGMGSARLYPAQEKQALWGLYSGGVSWRYYTSQRFLGGFGIDLEFMQRGFSYAPNASSIEDKADFLYYTRKVNSLMLPIVWQPHFYAFNKHVRIYLEAAAVFSYNISSTFENEVARKGGIADWKGDYRFKLVRDNRWGYGLAGGAGVAVLIKQFELNFRARYYFGYSDIVKNYNKYSGNADDGVENPFSVTPLRSPLDNLTISIGLSYRFNKSGFTEWEVKRPKKVKQTTDFNYKLDQK